MEGDNSGGEHNTKTTTTHNKGNHTTKGKDHYNNTNRDINHQELANMLRESADLVERGEFGSILYESLQDFRVYYKQNYPKTSSKKKKKHAQSTKKEKEKVSEVVVEKKTDPPTTATSSAVENNNNNNTDDAAGADAAILKDLKQSEDVKVEHTSERTTGTSSGEITLNNEHEHEHEHDNKNDADNDNDVDENRDASNKSEINTPAMEKDETAAAAVDAPSTAVPDGDSTKINGIPVALPIFTADVSVAPPSPSVAKTTTTTIPIETAVPIPPKMQPAAASASATASTTPTPRRTEAPPTPSSANRGAAVFGKFKVALPAVGATLNTVKKAALNVTGKNHHHNKNSTATREELEILRGSGVAMAESSGRRTSADGPTSSTSRSTNSGSSNSFKQNNDNINKTQTLAGMTGVAEHDARSRSNDNYAQSNEFNSYGNSNNNNVNDHHGNGKPPHPSLADQKQHGGTSVFESKRFVNQQQQQNQQQLQNTFVEEPSESNDTHDSSASRQTSTTADPIMEGGVGEKPSFQRPVNSGSSLVANGWIEQFRRSKFRHTWKEVLASLVEGQKPGEVTTLWIQRETINPTTGKTELEALHRIPLKVLEDVSFQDNSTDNQFRLKLHNSADEFVFRCNEAPNDALRWVQTLKKHERLAKGMKDVEEEKKGSESSTSSHNNFSQQQQQQHQEQHKQQTPSTKGMAIRDLRAICHGAGVNTSGMINRSELEAAAEEVQQRGTYFDQRGTATAAAQYPQQQQQQQQQQYAQNHGQPRNASPVPPQQQQRLGIKELRAICHGDGINTAGMERSELEAAANEVQSRGTYFDPPPGMHAPSEGDEIRARQEEYRRQQQQQQQNEELKRRQEQEAAAALEHRRREMEDARRRAAEEEGRRRVAEEEARRRAAAEEEARRRAAIEDQQRRQREAQAAQARYAQQQAAWQKQQQEDDQRRHVAEQKATEERRRRDEALRKQQEWAAPAPGARPPQQQQQQYHQQQQQQQQRHQAYPQQQQQWHQQQQQQQQQPRNHTPPPPQQQQQQQQRAHSGADDKYAKMANQSTDDGQATITKIKHGILIQWALQPPQLQMLRPIAALITTIHTVFPPSLGVSGHDYFKKWKPIVRNDIACVAGLPDEDKLKKSVRKIRFFLHPDKLPHNLNEEQKFMVKMLWDITSDAWEEYQKHAEDLDWVK
jgi:hypothetical protein